MFKSSPLKHKEGDSQSHAPYASEEAYHKKNPDKEKKEDGGEVDEGPVKNVGMPPGMDKHISEVIEKGNAENEAALTKANSYLEENKISANDFDVNNGVFTNKKDGNILHPEDDPETYDALNMSIIGDKDIFGVKKELDKKQPNKKETTELNKDIEDWGIDYVHNTKWSANQLNVAQPSVMDNTRVTIPPHVEMNSAEQVEKKEEKENGWREYGFTPSGDQDFETLWAKSKGMVAKSRNKTLFDIPDDDPEVLKNFKQMALTQESQAIYEKKLNESAVKESKSKYGKYNQDEEDKEREEEALTERILTAASKEEGTSSYVDKIKKKRYIKEGMSEEEATAKATVVEYGPNYVKAESNLAEAYDVMQAFSGEDSNINSEVKRLQKANKDILSKEYTDQASIDDANKALEENRAQLNNYQNQYNNAYNGYSQAFEAYNNQNKKALLLNETAEDFAKYEDIVGKDHGLFSKAEKNLAVGGLNMVAALENAAYKTPVIGHAYKGGIALFNPEWSEGRDKFQKNLRDGSAYISENIGETAGYKDVDSWYNLGDYAFNTAAQAAPLIATMAITKNPKLAMGLMYSYYAGDKYYELDKNDWLNQKGKEKYGDAMSQVMYHGLPLLSGTVGAISERFTFGRIQALKGVWGKSLKAGGPLSKGGLNSLRKQFTPKALLKGGKYSLQEGVTEWSDGLGQQIIRRYAEGDEKVVVGEGLDQDFMSGVTVSALLFRAPTVGLNVLKGYQSGRSQKQIDKNVARQEEISKLMNSGKISKEARETLMEEFGGLTQASNDIIRKDINNIDLYSRKEKENLRDINVEQSKLRNSLKDLQVKSNLTPNEKKKEAIKLKEKYYELEDTKEKLIRVYDNAQVVKKEEERNSSTVKDASKKVFGDNIEVISANSNIEAAELMELNLQERKVAILQQHANQYGQTTPLTEASQNEITEINQSLAEIQDLNANPNQKSLARGALTAHGFITPKDANGRQQIILNTKASLKDGFVTTAQHEFLHAVLNETLKNDDGARVAMGEALMDYIGEINTGSLADSELGKRMSQYAEGGAGVFNEEFMTLLSEAMVRENLPFKKESFQKIKDFKRRFFQNYHNKDIEFNTGRDVYNFLRDYNESIKKGKFGNAITKMAREGASGSLVEDGISRGEDPSKFSKEASDRVQSIYDEKGVDAAFEIMDDSFIKNNIKRFVERRSEAPGFDRELLTSEIQYGLINDDTGKQRSVMGLINDYPAYVAKQEESGDKVAPLAGFINKQLSNRMIEASRKILGEDFTDNIDDQIGLESDIGLPTYQDVVRKTSGVVISDRLGVTDKVNKAVREGIKDIDFNKVSFKNVPDLTRDVTADMFGISAKKMVNNANLTKGEVREAQQFIFKNADMLSKMLPDGATASGTSTGVQNVLLKGFYDKTERTKMAKTGNKAGLPIQVKKPNISKQEFTEFFGIMPAGTANLSDRNTSAKVLALAKQTSKMMSNQAIRQRIIKDESHPAHVVALLEDGKSEYMFSENVNFTTDQLKDLGRRERDLERFKDSREIGEALIESQKDWKKIVKGMDMDPIQMNTPEGRKAYKQWMYTKLAEKMPLSFFEHNGTWQGTTKGIKDADGNVIGRSHKGNYPYLNVQEVSDGISQAIEAGTTFAKKDIDIENAVKKVGYNKIDEKLTSKEFQKFNDSKRKGFKKIWKALEGMIQEDASNIPFVAAMLSSTSAYQGHFMRTASPVRFFNLLDGKNVEEHTEPASDLGKFLLNRAIEGNIDQYFDPAVESFFQGSLPQKYDVKLKGIGLDGKKFDYGKNIPAEYIYDVLMGTKPVWIRYINPNVNSIDGGINPNDIILENGSTLAQEYGVGVPTELITPEVVAKQQELLFDIFNGANQKTATETINDFAGVKFSKNNKEGKIVSDAVLFSRSSKNKPKGITVLDFDDTLATTKSRIGFTRPDGTTGMLNAEQYASDYVELAEQGYEFDFSEFNIVVGGKTAPLFNKALKLAGKFTTKDMFVLTARPPAAQKPIHDFLKANGLNIPIENITGLGNSTGKAKADWMAEKVTKGYNDFYFADDALQNVDAVKNMLEQHDVKSKVQQAKVKFSQNLSNDFNTILEQTAKMPAEKRFSDAKATKRGAKKNKFKLFVPYSHEDLTGMYYHFLGKGEVGNKQRDWFEKALIKPLNRAYTELNQAKQSIATDYKGLIKAMPDVRKKLTQQTPDGDFTYGDAIRVALWNRAGYDVPGLSKTDNANLVEYIEADPKLKSFADALSVISKQQEGYTPPNQYWLTEDIRSDLENATGKIGRSQFFQEWQENADEVFNPENLNKIEAVYGSNFREALEDLLYRTKTGNNRNFGSNRIVNQFMNFLNGSIGATMFFNARSAVLQTLSSVNFINYADNNIFKAGVAFANQPQFWKDFSYIFNSDTLKQRRGGLGNDLNASELTSYVSRSKSPVKAAINFMLQKGFLPTQIADSFAISSGGSTFYRNRIKKYEKEGLATKEAEQRAWTDFSEIAEATQQSARPDMISQQQASVLGRMILAFQNTPSQYNRLIKKAGLDLINRRKTKPYKNQAQSDMSNVSRILYYGAIQNLIFYSLQSALFAMLFDDDEKDEEFFAKKKDRIANSMIDGILRGSGVGGAVVSTVKNMIIKYQEQQGKTWGKDSSPVLLEALNISPPIGIKARKLVGAQKTMDYNKDVVDEMSKFNLENPVWSAVSNTVEATTNVPMARLYNKVSNVRAALDSNTQAWQRVALLGGWNRWDVGVDRPQSVQDAKEVVKEKKTAIRKEKTKVKKAEKKKEKEAEIKAVVEENKKKGKEDGLCAGVSKSGKRCKSKAVNGGMCTVHEKVKQNDTGTKTQCKGKRTNGKRCGMKTSSASGYCYYHD